MDNTKRIEKKRNYTIFFNNPIRVLIFLIAIIATIYIAHNVNQPGYDLLFLLPTVYGLVFIFFISPVLFNKMNIFVVIYTAVTFTRYILLPTLIVYSNWYGGRSSVPPQDESINLALLLMTYELIIISVFIYIVFNRKSIKYPQKNMSIKLPANKFIYCLFIFISLLLLCISPEAIKTFAFISPTDNMVDLGKGSTLSNITFYCLLTTKYLIFLLLLSFLYKKYLLTGNKVLVFLSFLIVLINILIIFGDNRADFIITSIVSMSLFYKMFPNKSKFSSIAIIIIIIIITSLTTDHRGTVTKTKGENLAIDLTDTLQIYIGGPYNVAIAIESAKLNPEPRNSINFSYEMLRPVMGINILLKDVNLELSNHYFNERIFFSNHYSQINPIIGQGYFYFGFLGSPLIMIFFIIFVRLLIGTLQKQSRIELLFFLSIPISRVGLAMGQNATILINDATFFLVLNLFVYLLNNKITFKSKFYV